MSIELLDQKIKKQDERLKQLKAQKRVIEAREKKKQVKQQRNNETRRKILLGSYLLKKMEHEANKEKILAELNEYLTEDRDRKLFNFECF
ncbi:MULTISPECIES: mobilization protein [unclassified Acinetobacter]|uniref:mobilization protein n=1 Tax=unclassified Acinetobacter TaxID=196816 RepID=UPI001C21114D|nr:MULTISPECIES: mobilization protein [unclassified Acinetobacter]